MKRNKYFALALSACLCLNTALPVMAADAVEAAVEETVDAAEAAVEETADAAEAAVEETADAAEAAVAEAQDAAEAAVEEAADAVAEAAEAAGDVLEDAAAPAAGSELDFQSYLKAKLAESIEMYGEQYEKNLEIQKKSLEGTDVTISAALQDAGRAILGMLAPIDLSWLNSLDLAMGVSIQDGTEAEIMTLYVNDKPVVTANIQLDMETMDMLMAVPELSPVYLKSNYIELMSNPAVQEEAGMPVEIDPQMLKNFMSAMVKFAANPPEKDVVTRLMDKFLTSFIDAFEVGENSEYTIEAGGISEDTTVLSGLLTSVAAQEWATKILNDAKEDEDILSLITAYAPEAEDGTDPVASWQKAIDGLLEEMDGSEGKDDEGMILRLCVNADGETVGSQSSLLEGEEEQIICTMLVPSDGSTCPLQFDADLDGTMLAIEGTGALDEEGYLDGTYTLKVDDEAMAEIEVSDYDPEALAEGGFYGHYTIRPAQPAEDAESYNAQMLQSLQGFELSLDADLVPEGGDCDLALSMSGAELVRLTMSAGLGEPVEFIDPETLGEDEVAGMDEEGMQKFMGSMDPTTILGNLADAGVTEEVLNGIFGSMIGGAPAEAEAEPAA